MFISRTTELSKRGIYTICKDYTQRKSIPVEPGCFLDCVKVFQSLCFGFRLIKGKE